MGILRLRTLLFATALAAPPTLYVRSKLLYLEKAYPPLRPEQSSTPDLRTPRVPGIRTAYTDVYGVRVPVNALRQTDATADGPSQLPLEELWAKAFLRSKVMKLEAFVAGFGSYGDLGEQGFKPGQRVVANLMHVLRPPSKGTPLLIEWSVPPESTRFFEKLASWGYPWRLMEGGRHEWSVGPVSRLPGETEDMVEVRFAAAHDFKVVEGEEGEGKMLPKWVGRAHRGYARLLLDEAAKEIRDKSSAR